MTVTINLDLLVQKMASAGDVHRPLPRDSKRGRGSSDQRINSSSLVEAIMTPTTVEANYSNAN